MFAMIAAGIMACGQCCGSKVEKQIIPPIINNNIVTPSPNSCKSSKVSFVKELVEEVRSINGEAGSLNGYDSDTEIDVHVRLRTETHAHIDTTDLVKLAKQVGFKDKHKGEVDGYE